jgi:hypothetical protein
MNYVACCRQPGAWLKRHSRSRMTAAFAPLTPSRHRDSAPRAHDRVRLCGPPLGEQSHRYHGRCCVRLRSRCTSQTSLGASLFPRAHLYTDKFSQCTTGSPDRQRARTAAKVRRRVWRGGQCRTCHLHNRESVQPAGHTVGHADHPDMCISEVNTSNSTKRHIGGSLRGCVGTQVALRNRLPVSLHCPRPADFTVADRATLGR